MGINKSIQYSIFCENYFVTDSPELSCNNYEDFEVVGKSPKKYYKQKGYKEINGKWYCKQCADKLTPHKTTTNE